MADYDQILDSELDPGSPMNTSLFTRLARNPEAIAEGADGAPPVQMAAFGDIVAGDTEFQWRPTPFSQAGSSYATAVIYTALQAGTVRVKFSTNASGGGNVAWQILVDGVVAFSNSTGGGNFSHDLTVDHGSKIEIQVRGSSTSITGTISNLRFCSDAASPTFPLLVN